MSNILYVILFFFLSSCGSIEAKDKKIKVLIVDKTPKNCEQKGEVLTKIQNTDLSKEVERLRGEALIELKRKARRLTGNTIFILNQKKEVSGEKQIKSLTLSALVYRCQRVDL